ncbi:MRL1 [Symbiodinium sp. CCMP2592]|nr:MRL1 [Symbiodinium sp. CCMP2592]
MMAYDGDTSNTLQRVTSLTAAQAKATKWMCALLLSKAEMDGALEPDLMLVTSRLSALEKGSAWRTAAKTFGVLQTNTGLRPGVFALNSVLSAFANAAAWTRALGLIATWRDRADLVSCNAVLTALSRCSRWAVLSRESWQHHHLGAVQTSLDGLLRCNNVAAAACGKGGRWETTLFIISTLGRQAVKADAVSLRTAVSAFERGMCWSRAVSTIRSQTIGVAGINSAISACRNAKAWKDSLQLINEIWHCNLRPTLVSWGAVAGACHGIWATCFGLLRQGGASDVSVGTASEACSAGGAWTLALALLAEGRMLSLQLDAMTWDGLLSAFSVRSLWGQALAVLEPKSASGLSIVALEAAVSALASAPGPTGQGVKAMPKALSLARAEAKRSLRSLRSRSRPAATSSRVSVPETSTLSRHRRICSIIGSQALEFQFASISSGSFFWLKVLGLGHVQETNQCTASSAVMVSEASGREQ